jgi:hypothetical protein
MTQTPQGLQTAVVARLLAFCQAIMSRNNMTI